MKGGICACLEHDVAKRAAAAVTSLRESFDPRCCNPNTKNAKISFIVITLARYPSEVWRSTGVAVLLHHGSAERPSIAFEHNSCFLYTFRLDQTTGLGPLRKRAVSRLPSCNQLSCTSDPDQLLRTFRHSHRPIQYHLCRTIRLRGNESLVLLSSCISL